MSKQRQHYDTMISCPKVLKLLYQYSKNISAEVVTACVQQMALQGHMHQKLTHDGPAAGPLPS